MRLTTTTIVTVDGVMQGLGGPDEDRRGGFERGGWVAPLFDNEAMTFLNQIYQRADAFLFGRRTYDMFESFWPHARSAGAMAEWINATPKIVFSRTRKAVTWSGSRLAGELDRRTVEALKREPGDDLIVFGSGAIVTQLTALGLVDEYQLIVSPLFVGRGRQMLGGLEAVTPLELLEARRTAVGNVLLRYARAAR